MARPPRIPSMVDRSAFRWAGTSPPRRARSSCARRCSSCSSTGRRRRTVREQPLLVVPPMINKYYVADLAPGRSMIEHAVGQGQQVFAISWRNPDERHADWDLDTYAGAIVEALDAVEAITGSRRTHVLGPVRRRHPRSPRRRGARRARRAGADRRPVARRLRARPARRPAPPGRCIDRADGRARRGRLGAARLPRRAGARRRLRVAAAERPDLELLGLELPARAGPAGLRHPLLERRHDEHARRPAPRLRAPGAGERAGRARASCAVLGTPVDLSRDHGGHLPRGGHRRPHHAVAELLPQRRSCSAPAALRALHERPHRGDGQPARQREGDLPRQRRAAADADAWLAGASQPGQLVGGLDGLARRAVGRRARRARGARRRGRTRRSAPRRGRTCGSSRRLPARGADRRRSARSARGPRRRGGRGAGPAGRSGRPWCRGSGRTRRARARRSSTTTTSSTTTHMGAAYPASGDAGGARVRPRTPVGRIPGSTSPDRVESRRRPAARVPPGRQGCGRVAARVDRVRAEEDRSARHRPPLHRAAPGSSMRSARTSRR